MDHLIIREHSRFDLITLIFTFFYNLEKNVYFLVFLTDIFEIFISQWPQFLIFFFLTWKSAVFFFFQSQDLDILCIIHVYTWTCVVWIICYIRLVTSQMSVPAAHTCFTDSNSWKVELCTCLNGDFETQITLTFSLVSGQWDIVFICLDLVGLIYFSVLIIIDIITLICYAFINKWAIT